MPQCRGLKLPGHFVCEQHVSYYAGLAEELKNHKPIGIVRPQLATVLCLQDGCRKAKQRGNDYCVDHDPRW